MHLVKGHKGIIGPHGKPLRVTGLTVMVDLGWIAYAAGNAVSFLDSTFEVVWGLEVCAPADEITAISSLGTVLYVSFNAIAEGTKVPVGNIVCYDLSSEALATAGDAGPPPVAFWTAPTAKYAHRLHVLSLYAVAGDGAATVASGSADGELVATLSRWRVALNLVVTPVCRN